MNYRPIPFYFINSHSPAELSPEAAEQSALAMKDAGYGGIIFFNKPDIGFSAKTYLTEPYFAALENFIVAYRRHHLDVWVNDGFNFPPGDAAGRIAASNPGLVQLRIRPNATGELQPVATDWGFPAFEDSESSRLFIEYVYESHYRRLGQYFGNGLTGFFSDADCRRVNYLAYGKLKGERFYPWSNCFARQFQDRFGYDITRRLKGLFDETDKQATVDYWTLAGELYQQWFFNNAQWCRAHGLKYSFHSSDSGPLAWQGCYRSSIYSEGAPLRLLSAPDFPGTDHEILVLDSGTHYDKRLFTAKATRGGDSSLIPHPRFNDTKYDTRAKLAGSAAFLYNKERTLCEMFAATNFGATHQDLRRIAAWQIMQGINFIVPHAVHHRFRDELKFFAPPEFLHSTLHNGLRAFNDELARLCEIANTGSLQAEIALLDPTEQVWAGANPEPFFAAFDRLNRNPAGFVICTREESRRFPIVIDAIANPVLPDLPDCGISFSGGELAYMRRLLPDGTPFLLAANLWSDNSLAGTLKFNGKSYELELAPGEIAVLGGPHEQYRSADRMQLVREFAGLLPVTWEDENVVPFQATLNIRRTDGNLPLSLAIPLSCTGQALCNGLPLDNGKPCFIADDEYIRYELPAGENLAIVLKTAAPFWTPALLTGKFAAVSRREGDWDHLVMQSYQLDMYEPAFEQIIVSPESDALLADAGWQLQGRPFYSGTAVYDLGDVDIPAGAALALPGLGGSAELLVDGKSLGWSCLLPYGFPLNGLTGVHHLQLRCSNTYGNRMERYLAPSGLTAAPQLKA